jgi:hypothetical protein
MSDALRFIPPRVQLVDPRTGMISREWYLFFQGVFNRIGGSEGASTPDIVASLFEDAGSSETNAMLFTAEQSFGQQPAPTQFVLPDAADPEVAALRAEVAELKKVIDSVLQGTLL